MRLSLPDFRTAPATHIVSLGKQCAGAFNLRRFYNFNGAFPFDWWVSPSVGVVGFLQRLDVEYLYDPALLERVPNGSTVRHRELDISLHHEFPRVWTQPGHPIAPDWQDHLDKPKKRTAALLEKLLALNIPGHRIAFVRVQEKTIGPARPTRCARRMSGFALSACRLHVGGIGRIAHKSGQVSALERRSDKLGQRAECP